MRQNHLRFVVQRSTTERRRVREAFVLVIPLVCAFCTVAHAQIRTDGSLNRPVVTLSGPNFLITEAQGRLAGSNLFYSFQAFNVGTAESATFVTTTAGLANVISRVTGGSPSQINGPVSLQSTNAAPNFFFINPAGVVFGQGAKIDVPAGFHVSTADYLKFPDGNFYVDPKAVSTLSSAAPEAFGFLGRTRASITIENGADLQTTSPKTDQPISIVAGDIEINGATLQTNGSDIRLVAVGSNPQEVGLTGALPDAFGNLNIVNGGLVTTLAVGGLDGGNIWASAGNVTINDGGQISAFTATSGNAGAVNVKAGTLVIDGSGSNPNYTEIVSEAIGGTGNAGNVNVTVNGAMSILNGGDIDANTFAAGNAGTVTVQAGTLVIDGSGNKANFNNTGIYSQAGNGSTGNAGNVNVTVNGAMSILNGGDVDADTYAGGNAGTVTVKAGTLVIDAQCPPAGGCVATGIFSDSHGTGNSGTVNVSVDGALSILGGAISSRAGLGNAGAITVKAGTLVMEGENSQASGVFSGIISFGYGSSTLNGGDISVTVDGTLTILGGAAQISAGTNGSGNGGNIAVKAGTFIIEGLGISSADVGGTGNAGNINVTVTGTLLMNPGFLETQSFGAGKAGTITVKAGGLVIDGGGIISNTGGGNAGSVNVTVDGAISIVNGGQISTNAPSSGNAGTVTVNAGTLVIDGGSNPKIVTGITSDAGSTIGGSSTGNAGDVHVSVAGTLSIVNGGEISSSTYDAGSAGSATVKAGAILGDDGGFIGANAYKGSSGQTGTVAIQASDGITLTNGASFSITNDAMAANPSSLIPTLLTVKAPNISLTDGAQITAASSGNVAASDIRVNFGPQLTVTNAGISTRANNGNGGSIVVSGAGTLLLQNGQITTSVAGLQGNGGDISIQAPVLVMETGFIQANTAAANASGGKVTIDVDSLIPSGSTRFVGGATPYTFMQDVFGFNVIQAAAQRGVSGTIQISTPVQDIIGSISALPAEFLDSGGLGRSPCAIVGGSSLSQVGRGSMPRRGGDLLWIDPSIEIRLTPPAGFTGSGSVVPPYRAAVSNMKPKTNPCWS